MRVVRDKRITEDFFYDVSMRDMFSYIQRHFIKYGQVPSVDVVGHEFPREVDQLPEARDTVAVLCDKLREKKLYNDMGELVRETMKASQSDPFEAFNCDQHLKQIGDWFIRASRNVKRGKWQ